MLKRVRARRVRMHPRPRRRRPARREESPMNSPTESSGVVVERDGAVLTLRLDRPAKRNAIDAAMLRALESALAAAATDPAVRAVILTGGEQAFAAGVLEEARAWAQRLAAQAPLALAMAKRAIDLGADLSLQAALELEQQSFVALFGTADEQEGVAAFLEKRPPRFQGR